MAGSKKHVYHEPNDAYFREHLTEFVKEHGGEWVVREEELECIL